ncbi:MAG: ferritin-like domain-containing protein [Burkholderiales bacterium]|nr:ferritin-like domain-containing protein [Anaerolineae bacterium]
MMAQISRRSLVKGALLGGASFATFSQLWGFEKVFGQTNGDDAQTILNVAATSEMFATTHYYTVLTESTIALTPDEVGMLQGFLDAELQHLEYLFANGAVPITEEYYFPENVYTDRQQFSDITEQVETVFVGAYIAATRQFAELGLSLLAGTAAQVAAIEQEHLALVRGIGGKRPNNVGLARAIFYDVAEAAPVLQPFLEGAAGYDGPRQYPGADAVREVIRDAGVVRVTPFTNVPPSAAAQTASVACTVTSGGQYNCNLRSGPGLNFPVIGRLAPGERLTVNGQVVDNDGFPWWRAEDGINWVRSDIVSVVEGSCEGLPVISDDGIPA